MCGGLLPQLVAAEPHCASCVVVLACRSMGEAESPSTVAEQLGAISSLSSVLDQHGLDHWLFGGWAVDLWVGRVTRPHDDIDVAAWRRDYDRIKAALETAGWEHTPTPDDLVGTRYRWRSTEVEFTFLDSDPEGKVVIPLEEPVVWSAEPLGNHRRELRGVGCRVIPLELLRSGKSDARAGAAEGAKDRADFEALSALKG